MRVVLDATAIPAERGGVGRYVDELVRHLGPAGADVAVVAQLRDVERFAEVLGPGRVVPAPAGIARRPVRLAWEQLGLPAQLRRWRPDLLHSPHYTMPLLAGVPVVVTLHDATFFSHPELHLPAKRTFFRVATRVAVRRAAGLVVPSAATRDEVVRYTGADPAHFTVAFHGVDSSRFRVASGAERERARALLDLPDGMPYLAFLGTLEPRKNVPELIRGWVQACGGLDRPPALVLAGATGWDAHIESAVASVPPSLVLRRPGYLPVDDLAGYLSGAALVTYPSLGEGFGLPVLEAMASGACVLTTRRLSLPEVGGDSVAYCEPDADSIASALRALMVDPGRRTELSRLAVARARSFTWEAAAEAHVVAYGAALRRTGRAARTV